MKDLSVSISGLTAIVHRSRPVSHPGGVGIGVAIEGGEPTFVLSVHHGDGDGLAVFLNDKSLDELCHRIAEKVERLNALQRQPRFGELG